MTTDRKLNVKDWQEEDRPREKLMLKGAETLSNAELLAILIGSGSPDETAVGLMQRILADNSDNLNRLGKLSLDQLCKYKGIGEAKAVTILAAMELGKRRQREEVLQRKRIDNPDAIFQLLHTELQDKDVEEAWILLLNQNFRLIRHMRISSGGITETMVDVRIIIREALLHNATVVALCHNHPSGNVSPSRDDDRLTARVKAACDTMRIHFLDHIIIGENKYYSYREEGKI